MMVLWKIKMKHLFLFILLLCTLYTVAQEKYLSRNGVIIFQASEKTFEPVKANNNSVSVILNINTGEIASLALIKEFTFRNALMQEHFNENYLESDTFPKATFKGKIVDFNFSELSTTKKTFDVIGILNLHGVDKEIETKLSIFLDENHIYLNGSFITSPMDFNIDIPKIVRNKIAKKVKVDMAFKLSKR